MWSNAKEGNMELIRDMGECEPAGRTRRAVMLGVAATVLAGGMVAVGATSAFAVGGTCSASKENVSLTGPDGVRVKASCSSLQGDSMARGNLDVTFALDEHTSWFTSLNTVYRSDYVVGPTGSASYTITHV